MHINDSSKMRENCCVSGTNRTGKTHLGIKLRESGQDISYGENPVEKAHRAGASVELSLTASSVSQTSIHMAEAGAADQVTQFLRTVA